MRNRIRHFNKYVINPLLRHFATLSFGPFALIQHIGRKSGKRYATPIMAFPMDGGFLVALTYGSHTDWYQNMVTAGGGKLVWHQKTFPINGLEPVDPAVAIPLFPQPQRTILKSLNLIHEFVKLAVEA